MSSPHAWLTARGAALLGVPEEAWIQQLQDHAEAVARFSNSVCPALIITTRSDCSIQDVTVESVVPSTGPVVAFVKTRPGPLSIENLDGQLMATVVPPSSSIAVQHLLQKLLIPLLGRFGASVDAQSAQLAQQLNEQLDNAIGADGDAGESVNPVAEVRLQGAPHTHNRANA